MNPLISKFKTYGNLPPEVEKEVAQYVKSQTKQKGDFFLKKGQIVSSLFIIETGLVRAFYLKDDCEINSWFGFENIILGSVFPIFYDQPSSESIQFLEETTYHYILSKDLNELYRRFPEMNTIGRKMTEEYCVILEERINSLQTQTAEERHHTLLRNEPSATQRISLGNIASYLGIKPETLSRIRKKQS